MPLRHYANSCRLCFVLITGIFSACTNSANLPDKPSKETAATADPQPLKVQLDAKRAAFEETATADKKKIYKEGIEAVEKSGILQKALQVGYKAPDFTLPNAVGKEVSLYDYLKKGRVILTWYRGGWCPYCNLTLHQLQEELPNFKAAGANLLALTPEVPDKSMTTIEKNKLAFEVLSDKGNTIGKEWGVVFKLTPEVAASYEKSFGLSAYNGNTAAELPLAATYIIEKNGIVSYAFLDADYRNRAEPAALTQFLKNNP